MSVTRGSTGRRGKSAHAEDVESRPAASTEWRRGRPGRRAERSTMRYMLLMNYGDTPGVTPMAEWAPEDARARGEAMMAIHEELTGSGELVGTEGLTGPEAAKIVKHDGVGAPVITDGPFPESKELLAGYWLVDVESEQRAIEI